MVPVPATPHAHREQRAGEVRHPRGRPHPRRSELVPVELGHGRAGSSSSCASRSSGANAATSGGTGAPAGRHRARVRAAVAAASGARCPAAPKIRQAASHRSEVGFAATAAATEVSAANARSPRSGSRKLDGSSSLGVGQVGLREPGEELHSGSAADRAADEQRGDELLCPAA